MAATSVLTRAAWNDLLTRINNLAQNPPAGCKALAALPLATAPHRWSGADITAARSKLSAICSTNVFIAPATGVWMKSVIDELNTAIGKGWCKCQQACCVPNKTGTVPMPGGYNVTIPYSQIITQYLYGNVSYSDMVAAIGSDVVTGLAACISAGGTTGQIIQYTQRHLHWTNCIYQDRWIDGGIRSYNGNDTYSYTCSNTDTTVVGSGWVPSLTPAYASGTATGSSNYYDQPIGMGYNYDYQAGRYYETFWLGAFDMDAYVYDLSVTKVCP
jgi:hypothetical protein